YFCGFIQTQTRIWLGEVLQIRLEEQMTVSDLLADGELLYVLFTSSYVSIRKWTLKSGNDGVSMDPSESSSSPSSSFSSSSSESSFRELDDVFLQTQTRIWLGEVLQIRLEEQMTVSDLLADGELLFEVSKVVWKMLLTNQRELRHICKILGLTGIDLFSPSDVVEKRDTRKVPDFDVVTYTVAMPTDMVGCIRRSWELPKFSVLNSASENKNKNSSEKFRQKHTITNSGRNYDMHSEDSDGTEINHMVIHIDGSSTKFSYDMTSQMSFDLENCGGAFSMVKNGILAKCLLQVDIQNQEKIDYSQCQLESPCTTKSVGSLCTQCGECDHLLNNSLSPSSIDSQIHLSDGVSPIRSQVKHSNEISEMDVLYYNCSQGYGTFIMEGSINDYTPAWRYFASQLDGTDSNDPVLYNGEDRLLNASSSVDSHCSNSTPRIFETKSKRRLADMFDGVEVSSVASMSSVSDAVLNLDLEDRFDTDDDSKIAQFPEFQNEKAGFLTKKTARGYRSQDIVKYETQVDSLTPHSEKAHFCMELEDKGSSTKPLPPYPDPLNVTGHPDHVVLYDNDVCMSHVHSDVYDEDKLSQIDSDALKNVDCMLPSHSHFPLEFHKWDLKGKCATVMLLNENAGHGASLVSVSEDVSLGETLHHMPAKASQDAFRIEDLKSFVGDSDKMFGSIVVNLDPNAKNQRDEYSQGVYLNDILDGTYDDSSDSPNTVADEGSEKCSKLRSIECDRCLQNQDIIGDIGGRVNCMSDMVTVDNSALHHNSVILANPSEPTLDEDSCLKIESSENVDKNGHQACTSLKDPFYCTEQIDKVYSQPHKRLLLKSVVSGTAAFGLLFLVFHLRKSGREKGGVPNIKSSQMLKANGGKSSSRKGGRANGIYPAEKLKFGD
ncbi:protein opaque10, partial [Quercus suber]